VSRAAQGLLYKGPYEVKVLRRRHPQTLFLSSLALFLTGCGAPNGYRVTAVPQSTGYTFTGTSSDGSSDYRCPSSPNVMPNWDRAIDGSGRYTVCPSRTDFANILIHGKTSVSNEICVFPAQYISETNIYTKPAADGTGAMNACIQATQTGVYASFKEINYNAVFIVEKRNHQQMVDCLILKNYNFCPEFSFGVFR
jgi:hypothetical protein